MTKDILYTKDRAATAFQALKERFHWKNPMEVPQVKKVVISVGVGSYKDKKKFEVVEDRLAKITGQKAVIRKAKKSVASFKSRQGDTIGYQVTLRGARMLAFLDRLLSVAFPRTKDFRGISRSSVDPMGNATFGIKEHVIFPETADEELKDIFGLAVTVVTTAQNKEEAIAFFEHLGFPFKKEEASQEAREKKKRKRVRRKKEEVAAPAPAA